MGPQREGLQTIRIAALIGMALVASLLAACDVQVTKAAGKTGHRSPNVPTFERARKQARQTQLLSRVQTVRSMCEMYSVEYGRYPDFENQGWSELTQGGFLQAPPVNPLSPKSTATRIRVASGLTGSDVDPREAGWVFSDGVLYAAGLDR